MITQLSAEKTPKQNWLGRAASSVSVCPEKFTALTASMVLWSSLHKQEVACIVATPGEDPQTKGVFSVWPGQWSTLFTGSLS